MKRQDDANAFLPDNAGHLEGVAADNASSFGEEFLASALAGESVTEDASDEVGDGEEGGFIALADDASLLPEDTGEDEPPTLRMDFEDNGLEDIDDADIQRAQQNRGARWAATGI